MHEEESKTSLFKSKTSFFFGKHSKTCAEYNFLPLNFENKKTVLRLLKTHKLD